MTDTEEITARRIDFDSPVSITGMATSSPLQWHHSRRHCHIDVDVKL